jgi:hypothetical protein
VKYTIPAKPTVYKGVTFRSKHEAHWAAFFDYFNWSWAYEPFNCNGWLPDFKLGELLVEVKPFAFTETVDVRKKMDQAVKNVPLLLLLQEPKTTIGYLKHSEHQDFGVDIDGWEEATISLNGGITSTHGLWHCYVVNSNDEYFRKPSIDFDKIRMAWGHACHAIEFDV